MNDEQLELISTKRDKLGVYQRICRLFFPWYIWESENSSYGKCFRERLGLPDWFQLPFVCPDGAFHGSKAHENVLDARSELYFG